jgi:small subunit ribosomal protein S6
MSRKRKQLREYETILVLNPDITDDVVRTTMGRFKDNLKKSSAEVLREDVWGKRRLAFECEKVSRGNFVVLHYAATPGVVEDLERDLRNSDVVLRFITTYQGEIIDLETRRAEIERLAAEHAEALRRAEAAPPPAPVELDEAEAYSA